MTAKEKVEEITSAFKEANKILDVVMKKYKHATVIIQTDKRLIESGIWIGASVDISLIENDK